LPASYEKTFRKTSNIQSVKLQENEIKPTYLYKAFGLIFKSEIELPELIAATGRHDVEINFGTFPLELDNASEKNDIFQASNDQFIFKLNNIAAFLVQSGKSITIQPFGQKNERDIRLFLLGSVFGALLHQRGCLVLHGSAVEIDGRGVIFTGQSGAGKSTLVAAFHNQGFRVLTDDVVSIQLSVDGVHHIVPGFPNIKLWQDAADKLNKNTAGLEPIRDELAKFRVAAEEHYLDHPLAISALYILTPTEDSDIQTQKLSGFDKVTALIVNTYRLSFLKGQGCSALHLKQCADLSKKIEVVKLIRPRDKFLLTELTEHILKDYKQFTFVE